MDRQSSFLQGKTRIKVIADAMSLRAYELLAKDFYASVEDYEVVEPNHDGKQQLWEEGVV